MVRTYDIFEKFPDGCSIWRACASGQFEVERKLQELAEHSENEFFAIDLGKQERITLDMRPGNSPQEMNRSKRIA
jgi:hypothetical protein